MSGSNRFAPQSSELEVFDRRSSAESSIRNPAFGRVDRVLTVADLPVPETLWARWTALSAAMAGVGYADVWLIDDSGALHDDHCGNWARLALIEGDQAVLYGYDHEYSETVDAAPPIDLLDGAPDWLPWDDLTGRRRLIPGTAAGCSCASRPPQRTRRSSAATTPGRRGGPTTASAGRGGRAYKPRWRIGPSAGVPRGPTCSTRTSPTRSADQAVSRGRYHRPGVPGHSAGPAVGARRPLPWRGQGPPRVERSAATVRVDHASPRAATSR